MYRAPVYRVTYKLLKLLQSPMCRNVHGFRSEYMREGDRLRGQVPYDQSHFVLLYILF